MICALHGLTLVVSGVTASQLVNAVPTACSEPSGAMSLTTSSFRRMVGRSRSPKGGEGRRCQFVAEIV